MLPEMDRDVTTPEEERAGPAEEADGIPLWAIELGCWTMVVLAPFLYWINGPAVSTDQLVVRSGLVGFALGGGLVLRLVALSRGASTAGDRPQPDTTEDGSQAEGSADAESH